MNMQNFEDLDIEALVERFEQMRATGKKIYFDADEFASLADYYMSLDDNYSAKEIIEEGMKIHPDNSMLTALKAKVLVSFELYEEAMTYLDNVSEDDDIEIMLVRIEAMFHTNREGEAYDLVGDILDSNLSPEENYYFITELGYILNDIEQYDHAILLFEESLHYDDSNIDVLVDLVYSYEMRMKYDKAIVYNNRLLDLDPYSYDSWVNMGKLYSLNEQYDEAVGAFDFAHTIQEGDVDALKMKALSLFLNDNATQAIDTFKECINLDPDDVSVYDSIIEGYESLDQYDDMIRFIDIKQDHFGDEGIVIKRAFVEILKDNIVKAWDYYHQVPEVEKDTLDFFILEGELNFISENFRESEAAYLKAALISEEDEDIIDRLANVSVAQDKYKQAEDYLEQLLFIDPEYPTAKMRLAFIRFEIGVKEPFDEIVEMLSDNEIRDLLQIISESEDSDYVNYSREQLLVRLNEARENRILFKNIKY